MPQYRLTQYGLSQYGYHQSGGPETPGTGSKWRFIRSRFGVRRNGHTVWLYQHQPATLQGAARKLRLRTNLGESIQEESTTLAGNYRKVRLSSNVSQPIISQRNERSPHQ